MPNYFREILKKLSEDEGLLLNSLITNGIISLEDATKMTIATKNVKYIYLYALHVKDAPISKLVDAVIDAKDAEYMYFFALYVKNTPIAKLADALIATKNIEYIYLFAIDVENAPIDKLAKVLFDLGAISLLSNLHSKLIENKPENASSICYIENLLSTLRPEPNTEIEPQTLVTEANASLTEIDYSALNDEQLFEELIKLYQSGNIEKIRNNREYFNKLILGGNELK